MLKILLALSLLSLNSCVMSEREELEYRIHSVCSTEAYEKYPMGAGIGFECHRNGKLRSFIRPEDIGERTPEWLRLTNDCDALVPTQMVFDHFDKQRTSYQKNCEHLVKQHFNKKESYITKNLKSN